MTERRIHPEFAVCNALNRRNDDDPLSAFEMRELAIPALKGLFKDVSFADGILTARMQKDERLIKYEEAYVRFVSMIKSADIHWLDDATRERMLQKFFTFNKNTSRFLVTNYVGSRVLKAIRRMSPPMGLVYFDNKQRKYVVDWRRKK